MAMAELTLTSTKRAFMSGSQKTELIKTVSNNEQLKKGKFSAVFTHKSAQEEWARIANILNAMPGARKTPSQWKRVSFVN